MFVSQQKERYFFHIFIRLFLFHQLTPRVYFTERRIRFLVQNIFLTLTNCRQGYTKVISLEGEYSWIELSRMASN